MPDGRVQLSIEIETQGAEQLTALRRELDALRSAGTTAFAPLDASLSSFLTHLQQSRQVVTSLEPIITGFFQRLLAGTRNFRDAFKRLLLDLLDFFIRVVARMVAAWLTGLRRMRGAGGGLNFSLSLGGTPPTFPGFAGGGLVDDALRQLRAIHSARGEVLALLHPGEAVLSPGAVRLLGPARITAFNRAGGGTGRPEFSGGRPSFQGGGLVGPSGVGQTRMSGPPVINIFINGAQDPQATANAVIREIRRRARDQGLPRPV
ncbi:MAG: hypothetical protein HY653_02500 [Acidobacteria bacterium]|nr:hypothetical protein [Acidobacteriota bacterium]